MLLDEDPATLIHECTSNFHTTSDRDALARISSLLTTLDASRQHRLAAQAATLKKLARRQHALAQRHELDLAHADPAGHAEEMLRLDGVKFRTAKEASDAEIEGERLEGECRRAEGTAVDGRASEAAFAEDEARREREVLKLKVYRSLGIELDMGPEGECRRAVVRNVDSGRVDVVEVVRDEAASRRTERIWEVL